MLEYKRLAIAAGVALAVPAFAQDATDAPPEGATAEREALINDCPNHKFEAVVVIDPATNRGTRVKLCSKPDATDVDWLRTLQGARAQIEGRDMPAEPKDELLAKLDAEIIKYAPKGATIDIGKTFGSLPSGVAPSERYETSTLPPLVPLPRESRTASAAVAGGASAPARVVARAMAVEISCRDGKCDKIAPGSTIRVKAISGMERGGTLRFTRRNGADADVDIGSLKDGQTASVATPTSVCRGFGGLTVNIELHRNTAGGNSAAEAKYGPYRYTC